LPSFPLRRGSSLLFLLRGAFAPVHFFGFHSRASRWASYAHKVAETTGVLQKRSLSRSPVR
jgi:hypothetical protein